MNFAFRNIFYIVLFIFSADASVYYVSSAGNDANTVVQAQNSATPWKTIDRLNQATLTSGDTVCFHRGEVFYGSVIAAVSGTSGHPIVYRSYGTGEAPILQGSVAVSGWTESGSGLQSASFQRATRMLFCDGRLLALARYPNQGYRTVTDTSGSVMFTDSSLDGSTDWTGARAHIRTMRWTIASKTVSSFNTGLKQFTLSSAPVYGTKKGWGYFLNNHIAALDTAGEWFWDSSATLLKVRMPDNGPTSGHLLEAAVSAYGFEIRNSSFIVIESLTVRHYINAGIYATGGAGIVLRGLTIRDCDAYGINLNGTADGRRIEGCSVYGSNTDGIIIYANNAVIENNRILCIGLIDRLNASGLGDQCCSAHGLNVQGNNNVIRGNVLDSIGYIAINFGGQNALIEYNFVNHCCVTKDDGAGIYTWSSDYTLPGAAGSIVRYNIVMNSVGAPAGTDAPAQPGPANGIYMDDRIHDVEVYGNTTANCARWGYQLHNNYNLRFTDNTAFGNGHAQLSMNEDFTTATDSMRNNRISRNRFVSTSSGSLSLNATSRDATADMGTFDSNYYWHPYWEDNIRYISGNYNLTRWQALLGQDANSKAAAVRWTHYKITDTVTTGIIRNSDFESGITFWSRWPSTATLAWDTLTFSGSRCLKVQCPHDGVQQPIAITNNFLLRKAASYLLSFRARGVKTGYLTPVVRQAYSPYASRGTTSAITLSAEWRDYKVLFLATENDTPCRVDFSNSRADSVYWLDDVRLMEVTTAPEDTGRVRLYCNPTMRDSLIPLPGNLRDLDGNPALSAVTLLPFRSVVYYSDTVILVEQEPVIQKKDSLGLVISPNPFNPSVSFSLSSVKGMVDVLIYGVDGRKVAALRGKPDSAGHVGLTWTADQTASGIYLVSIRAGEKILNRTVTLLR